MKHLKFLFLLLLYYTTCIAQTPIDIQDTLLFRECFDGNILQTNLGLMQQAYDSIDAPRKVLPSYPGFSWRTTSDGSVDYSRMSPSYSRGEATGFNRRICRALKQAYISQHPKGENLDSVKADLVARLERFDTLATTKPLFYADIHGKYKGNIVRYVNDLYEKSMMGNLKRLEYFFHNPRKKLIQKDLGYQFSLSLALYEQWIAQVRNGEINEE